MRNELTINTNQNIYRYTYWKEIQNINIFIWSNSSFLLCIQPVVSHSKPYGNIYSYDLRDIYEYMIMG